MTDPLASLAALLEASMRGGYVAEMPTVEMARYLLDHGVTLAQPAPALDVKALIAAFRKVGVQLHEDTWHVNEYDLADIAAAYALEATDD